MSKQKLNRIGYITAAATFAIASFIMFAHYQGFRGDYEHWGILFIPVALLFNLSVLGFIILVAGKRTIKGPFRSIYFMLLNIPVAIFYIWFGLFLMGFYRVTIVNDTSSTVSKIELSGCDEISIPQLEAGEKSTIWIKLDRDCSLNISFLDKDRKRNEDIVAGYLCSGMGQSATYHISGKDNPRY